MTVDFDSITKDVNRHSKLMNDTDVSNVNKIVDANPSIFELGWDQPKTKRRDAGVYFKKVIRDGVEVDKPKYGFTFFIPTQIPQYQLFELFPGFENLDSNCNVIDASKNNGKPDRRILSSSTEADYKEYEFNAKNLPQFNGFQIKIVMTGTNFAYVPKIRDLRAIASI